MPSMYVLSCYFLKLKKKIKKIKTFNLLHYQTYWYSYQSIMQMWLLNKRKYMNKND